VVFLGMIVVGWMILEMMFLLYVFVISILLLFMVCFLCLRWGFLFVLLVCEYGVYS